MLPSQRLWKSLPLNSDDPFRWNCGSRDFTEWFVIWWASGFLLWYDFGWVLAVVVVVIWFWLGFGSSVWLEVMSLKSSGDGGLEGELGGQPWSTVWHGLRQGDDERERGAALNILGPKARIKNEAFFILIY